MIRAKVWDRARSW